MSQAAALDAAAFLFFHNLVSWPGVNELRYRESRFPSDLSARLGGNLT